MKKTLFSTKDIVKYLVVMGLIYTILKMIPSSKINNKDLILILAIITIGFIIIDYSILNNKQVNKEGFTQEKDPFDLDLNFDINALLKKKMEMQKEKESAKQKADSSSKSIVQPKLSVIQPKSEVQTSKLVIQPKSEVPTPKSEVPTPKSKVPTPKSEVPTPKSEVPTPKSEVPTPKSEVPTPKSEVPTPKSEVPTPKFKHKRHLAKKRKLLSQMKKSRRIDKSYKAESKVGCAMEVNKVKRDLENEINKLKVLLNSRKITDTNGKIAARYFKSLLNELNEKGILDSRDIENIQLKTRSKLLTVEEVISSLELLKKEGKSKARSVEGKVKNDMVYNEIPSNFFTPLGDQISNKWDNEYTILNTDKWKVPMLRPPVCINTTPCRVCPSDSSNYPVNLKQWDDSRYITLSKINKKWSDDQAKA